MEYYALVIGLVIAVYIVIQFRVTNLERKQWPYPMLLATFPIFYWVFAIYASDYAALVKEFAIGLVYLFIAYMAYRLRSFAGLLLLAFGYLGHALYDTVHGLLVSNQGAPLWWPEFCGSIDALIGLYLVYFAFSMRQSYATTP